MLVLLLVAGTALAGTRVERTVGAAEGLGSDTPHQIVVGQDGFVWVSSPQGVWRFDGQRFVPAVEGPARHAWYGLAPRPARGVYAMDARGKLVEIVDGVETELPLPDGISGRVTTLASEPDGTLWLGLGGTAWRRRADGGWDDALAGRLLPGEELGYVSATSGVLALVTNRGGFQVRGGEPQRVLATPERGAFTDLAVRPDGVWTMEWLGTARRWQDGASEVVWAEDGASAKLYVAADQLFLDSDRWLVSLDEAGRVEQSSDAVVSSIVEAPDGSVWFTRQGGLGSWPSPRTLVYGEADGLPAMGPRFVLERAGTVWATTWSGTARRQPGGDWTRPDEYTLYHRSCLTPDGALLGSGRRVDDIHRHDLLLWTDEVVTPLRAVDGVFHDCATDSLGSSWITVDGRDRPRSLLRLEGRDLAEISDLPVAPWFMTVDHRDVLWIADDQQLCRTAAAEVDTGRWRCAELDLPDLERIVGLVRTEDDQVWVATVGSGLAVLRGDRVVRHPRSDEALGTRALMGMRRSARGGAWLVGHGAIHRLEGPDLHVAERLGRWHGLPSESASDLAETGDGSLWIATASGLVNVPRSARDQRPEPPPLRLVAVRVDDRPVGGTRVEVPSPPNTVSIQATALAFRDPGRVRYRGRVSGGTFTPLADGRVQLVDLAPGDHRVVLEASLDGETWSEPIVVQLQVATPFWQRPWVIAIALVGIIGAVVLASRARLVWLLGRERERLRIAMDLHDELGSGLGSIRLLATLLGRERLDDATRVELAERIRGTTRELHGSVSELVGSLRPGGTTPAALVERLHRRGGDLLLGRSDLRVVLAPELASVELPLGLCRELERIGMEALHNAARHGAPTQVTIGLSRVGPRWTLWVDDDGRGFDPDVAAAGLGLASMRRRAERLGGTLVIRSAPDAGTTIRLDFEPRARRGRGRTP